ncbi:hypothetical protein Pst134EA_025490 [Puccinia striiformis f. sp. tritici]|uniref:hypothetical protein n=1 Tax=Puccinia striiformis f. sp. tritici TaxID=168172 RepID=UPI002007FC69|nr:hypothetical protein Pst134EA_025490 [Puccinia striiformis f. sp. tritici]KAH9451540.1 hypothetical protein Pst134EA_025490 [Puccinia striiformis f. sp. tritici]
MASEEIKNLTDSIDSLDPRCSVDHEGSRMSITDEPPSTIQDQRQEDQDQESQSKHPPIRLVCLDFEVENELRFGLHEFSIHSIRNNFNFISLLNHQHLLGHDGGLHMDSLDLNSVHSFNSSIYNSRINLDLRTPKSSSPSSSSLNSNSNLNQNVNLDNSSSGEQLMPEYWWFIKFIKSNEQQTGGYTIETSHPNFDTLSNTDPGYLSRVIEATIGNNSEGSERFVITIRYVIKSDAFRALGHILGTTRHYYSLTSQNSFINSNPNHQNSWNSRVFEDLVHTLINHKTEKSGFESLGLMVDCSRNGVLKINRVKELSRFISLMGLNLLQLYTEDTYQIKDEPFFGYFRGPYTQSELKEIDDYAYELGIEVVACIQTLGHLGQMLQWPRFGGMRDTHDVLLVGSTEVYGFIEKMIRAITTPLRSKKIHIGMDEAHGVSEGRYRQLYGHKDSCQVFTDHLNKVNQICAKLDLKPMIWSDMLFCLAAKNNSLGGYYDSSNPATPELVQSIPPEIELVYWDYYHTTSAPYINKINQHRDLNYKSPAMASGIWTWSRFWTALPFTIETITASMKAIKNPQSGVKHALTTIWGDEGNECDIWSALPGILFYADHAYSDNSEIDLGFLKSKFDGICGGSFDDFVFASKLDDLQPENQLIDDKARFTPNLSKWLIWEEPFYSILSPQYAGHDLETHYNQLSKYLDQAMGSRGGQTNGHDGKSGEGRLRTIDHPMNERLMLPNLIAKVLGLKCHLRDRLVHAYRHNDREELVALAGPSPLSRLSRLRVLCDQTWKYHRNLWMSMYKPFGWEVLDLRYGGLRARLESMHERLMGYLDPDNLAVDRIEELEVDTELVYPTSGAVMMLDYHRVSRPQYC